MSDNNIIQMEAIVKWYNPKKGFGFVIKDESFPDIFLHFSTLDSLGISFLNEGDKIICDVVKNYSGYQVIKIHEIIFDHSFKEEYEEEEIFNTTGEIKWYNSLKGFGFIYSDDDKSEIFFHSSILHPSMYKDLIPFQKVSVLFFYTEKGKEAKEIKFI